MATYTYNQKRTRKLQKAINNAPENSQVWFQPTHHQGCIQVLKMKDGSKTEIDYCVNTFRSSCTGNESFNRKTVLVNNCLQLDEDWIDTILNSKKIKFKANIKDGRVLITLSTTKKGGD